MLEGVGSGGGTYRGAPKATIKPNAPSTYRPPSPSGYNRADKLSAYRQQGATPNRPAPTMQSFGSPSAPAPVQAPAPAPAPVKPAPINDVDWFNSDSIYKGQAGRALADLTGQLAQILAGRDQGYQQLDVGRGDMTRGRQDDLTSTGDDFAGRGMLSSGLYAQQADDVAADYARQGEQLDSQEGQIAQQFGKRGAKVDLSGLGKKDPSGLNSIYGLLGALGLGAGNQYNSQLGSARADSAARSTAPLLQTTAW